MQVRAVRDNRPMVGISWMQGKSGQQTARSVKTGVQSTKTVREFCIQNCL
jgi:hypothetical protein